MHSIKYCRIFKSLTFVRHFSSNVIPSTKLIFENLSSNRSLLRVSGNEVFQFLQGLITNDINHVKEATIDTAMFTMFLNKPGRVLYDAIIYKRHNDENACFIECDQAIENDLKRHLMMFRVRKKIDITSVNNDLNIWVGFKDDRNASIKSQAIAMPKLSNKNSEAIIVCHDPRLNQLGIRFLVPSKFQFSDLQKYHDQECTLSNDDYNYIEHRYLHGVSEGSIEIPSTKTFPFEANCDYLHGISFHKGCYLGQEFTARTYHTGVIRKRIMPIVIDTKNDLELAFDTPILNETEQTIGKLKGIRNQHAIGSLRVDQALDAKSLKIGTLTASTYRPEWWPKNYKKETVI